MIGWLIALSYIGGSFGTWIAGALKIGANLEAIRARSNSIDVTTPEFRAAFAGVIAGLLWPVALPVYFAFNRGKAVGLKKKQMRALIEQQEREIARIKQQEGWQ